MLCAMEENGEIIELLLRGQEFLIHELLRLLVIVLCLFQKSLQLPFLREDLLDQLISLGRRDISDVR